MTLAKFTWVNYFFLMNIVFQRLARWHKMWWCLKSVQSMEKDMVI